MSYDVVSTPNAPGAIGPYSQAVSAGGVLYVSGQIPINPESGELLTGSVAEQAQQVMKNLKAVVEAGGSSMGKVIKCQIFLSSMEDFATVNEVYGSYFSEPFPARACVEVSKLPKGVDVEIDAIAQV